MTTTAKGKKKKRGFRSLKELDAAQSKVKADYKDIEENAVSNIFNPFDIATTVLPMVFRAVRKKRNSTKNPIEIKEANTVNLIETKPSKLKLGIKSLFQNVQDVEIVREDSQFHLFSPQKNDTKAKRFLAEVLRWQLIGIGIWGVSKLIKRKKK